MSQKKGQNKGEKRGGGGRRAIKNQIEKRRKDNKTLNQKNEKGWEKNFDKKAIKEKEPKIKVLTHELLAFTLAYLMLAPW
jgi:hypothetical protein